MSTDHPSLGPILRRRSSASTSFVLAALRALHVDPLLAGGNDGLHRRDGSTIINGTCRASLTRTHSEPSK
jgi:hypothetical protein